MAKNCSVFSLIFFYYIYFCNCCSIKIKKIKRYLFQVNVQISKPYITTSHFFRWCGIMEAVGCILLVKTIIPLISGLPNSLHSANYQICIFFVERKKSNIAFLVFFYSYHINGQNQATLDQHKFSRKHR